MLSSGCRADRLAAKAAELGADAFYVREVASIEWLTGFEDVFDEERAHAAMVFAGGETPRLHTDSRYVTAMRREAEGSPFQVDAEAVGMSEWAHARFEERFGRAGRLAIEDSVALSEYRALQKAFAGDGGVDGCDSEGAAAGGSCGEGSFVETHDVVLALRAVKDERELARMRAAQAVTDAAFAHIVGFIEPGMTEREVQLELDGYMLSHGASGLAFPSIVASGENGASPHAIVSDNPLEAGECVVMDFGARRAGYCSDMTRTVFLGEPDGEMLSAWRTMREANEAVQRMLRAGVMGREAHELAERILVEGGFGGRMGHGLGHGVGLQIHELPVLSTRNEEPLVAGNVVTVEPGIYIPGRFGMRLEDCGVVTDGGFERFTQSTHDMVVL